MPSVKQDNEIRSFCMFADLIQNKRDRLTIKKVGVQVLKPLLIDLKGNWVLVKGYE